VKLAYLTTEYPKVSHTFIRRELLEMERRGHDVVRMTLRIGDYAKGGEDEAEVPKTYALFAQPRTVLATAIAWAQATRPRQFIKAVEMAARMAAPSDRGIGKHMAYVAEAAVFLRHLESKGGVEHMHVHFGTNIASVARLMRVMGGPSYSMTIHGPDEFDAPRGHSLAEKIADSAFVVAISDFGTAQLKRWAAYEHWSKIHVVRCSVGDQFLGEVEPIPADTKTLLSIGRLSAQKGQLLLIDALKVLADEGHDFKVVLAGDGEMRGIVEDRIATCGLGNRVTITGWIDEATVRRHINSSRALILPSFAEGLPVVIMESLAMGRPVVSTMIAGIPELVKNDENGWLITAGSVESLVGALRSVVTATPEALNKKGLAGRERVKLQHYLPTEGAKLEALFQRYGGRS
jgi:colanic acid/amylovoran biosynthesis glycosyltransferase